MSPRPRCCERLVASAARSTWLALVGRSGVAAVIRIAGPRADVMQRKNEATLVRRLQTRRNASTASCTLRPIAKDMAMILVDPRRHQDNQCKQPRGGSKEARIGKHLVFASDRFSTRLWFDELCQKVRQRHGYSAMVDNLVCFATLD
jgi:hypothetical protein